MMCATSSLALPVFSYKMSPFSFQSYWEFGSGFFLCFVLFYFNMTCLDLFIFTFIHNPRYHVELLTPEWNTHQFNCFLSAWWEITGGQDSFTFLKSRVILDMCIPRILHCTTVLWPSQTKQSSWQLVTHNSNGRVGQKERWRGDKKKKKKKVKTTNMKIPPSLISAN